MRHEETQMDSRLDTWNKVFSSYEQKRPEYDNWLDKFDDILTKSADCPIIDLGCGFGNDSLYLSEKGYDVISCDYSSEALDRLKHFIPEPDARLFNMAEGLPFADKSAKLIIADLSLHYFSTECTKKIIGDISRVLTKDGFLICRLNSVNDINYGAGQGVEIEKNYYNIDGACKRFFDPDDIQLFLEGWNIRYAGEAEMARYKKVKITWEVAAENAEGGRIL